VNENNGETTEKGLGQGVATPCLKHTQRDAETQTALGLFVIMISLPVLVGTFWAVRPHAMVVNAIAGFILLGVGIGMVTWGRKTAKKVQKDQ